MCISLARLLECVEFLYLNNGDRQLWSKLLHIKKSCGWENVKDIVEQHFGSTSNHNQLRLGPLLNLQVIKTFQWPQNKQTPGQETYRPNEGYHCTILFLERRRRFSVHSKIIKYIFFSFLQCYFIHLDCFVRCKVLEIPSTDMSAPSQNTV